MHRLLLLSALVCGSFAPMIHAQDTKAKKTYGVEFDLFSKVKLLGKDGAPLYQFLTSKDANSKKPGDVQWNFEKFIIGRDGTIVARFLSDVEPDAPDFLDLLRQELNKK